MPVTFITLKMVFVLGWTIGDTSSLACQSLNKVQVSIKKIHAEGCDCSVARASASFFFLLNNFWIKPMLAENALET
jgi:hypothetical protein